MDRWLAAYWRQVWLYHNEHYDSVLTSAGCIGNTALGYCMVPQNHTHWFGHGVSPGFRTMQFVITTMCPCYIKPPDTVTNQESTSICEAKNRTSTKWTSTCNVRSVLLIRYDRWVFWLVCFQTPTQKRNRNNTARFRYDSPLYTYMNYALNLGWSRWYA